MNACPPRNGPTPAQIASDPCAMLDALNGALLSVLTTGNKVSIRNGDNWVQYSPVSVSALRAEIAKQERLCAAKRGQGARAFRAGPYFY
jgi:hypothetical protein